jgi:hypothetical protein
MKPKWAFECLELAGLQSGFTFGETFKVSNIISLVELKLEIIYIYIYIYFSHIVSKKVLKSLVPVSTTQNIAKNKKTQIQSPISNY